MTPTFAQLGIPFPLFEAPADQAHEYYGLNNCSLCDEEETHCFHLGIGCAVMVECPRCGVINGLDADDRTDCACRGCNTLVPFPELGDEEILVCHGCLQSGKAAITKDTELGMISWEQAFNGITQGLPGPKRYDFEMVPGESGWIGVRLPQKHMFDLLRTPTYQTVQGERWLFCCGQPMIFVGKWGRDEFIEREPDEVGRITIENAGQRSILDVWESRPYDIIDIYVFRCGACGNMKANWDIS